MRTQTRKNKDKGYYFQTRVLKAIKDSGVLFDNEDIYSIPMNNAGADLIIGLSNLFQFPFAVEIKNETNFRANSALIQAVKYKKRLEEKFSKHFINFYPLVLFNFDSQILALTNLPYDLFNFYDNFHGEIADKKDVKLYTFNVYDVNSKHNIEIRAEFRSTETKFPNKETLKFIINNNKKNDFKHVLMYTDSDQLDYFKLVTDFKTIILITKAFLIVENLYKR